MILRAATLSDTLRSGGDALQLDRPDPGTPVGAAIVFCNDGGFRGERPATDVLDPVGLELRRLLRDDDIPLRALAVSALPVATDDGYEGLPAGPGTGRGGVRAADLDGVEG